MIKDQAMAAPAFEKCTPSYRTTCPSMVGVYRPLGHNQLSMDSNDVSTPCLETNLRNVEFTAAPRAGSSRTAAYSSGPTDCPVSR